MSKKRLRFAHFLDQTLEKSSEIIFKRVQDNKKLNFPLVLKLVVQDIKYLRFVIINEEYQIVKKLPEETKIDCYMIFDKAKTIHYLLSGKISPLSSALIGKFKIIYLNNASRLFSTIYNPAKNCYLQLIKGTRFSIKKKK
ncbi:MAG: hypothetical protein MJB14_14915 [Spirochaetes bacterium]|nr:hypothetical protein [Spirochaetota bacterium]